MALNEKIEASRKRFEDLQTHYGLWPDCINRFSHNGEYYHLKTRILWETWCEAIEYVHKIESDKVTMQQINSLLVRNSQYGKFGKGETK